VQVSIFSNKKSTFYSLSSFIFLSLTNKTQTHKDNLNRSTRNISVHFLELLREGFLFLFKKRNREEGRKKKVQYLKKEILSQLNKPFTQKIKE
jgi:hypothetical protein